MSELKFRNSLAFYIGVRVALGWAAFQTSFMFLFWWAAKADGHTPTNVQLLERFSLSDAQGLGLMAAVIAVLALWLAEKGAAKLGVNYKEEILGKKDKPKPKEYEPKIKPLGAVNEEK